MFESVRHTRARQLVRRLGLTAKRRVAERLPLGGRLAEAPALAPDLPTPVFPARTELATRENGRWQARFLSHAHALTPPIVWRDFDWPHGTPLARLTLHYMEFLEAVDDAAFAAIVDDWIERNPPYGPRYWTSDWNSFAVSIRSVVWMQQWAARRPDAASPFGRRLIGSLARQLAFLERNLETDIGGNHLLKNVKALLWAGRFFTGEAAVRWSALGMKVLARELPEQLLPDGLHFERSPAYHAQVTADLVECWTVHPEGLGKDSLAAALGRAGQALADTTHPDGLSSLFNDGGLHMAYAPSTVLDAIARQLGTAIVARPLFDLPAAGYFGLRGAGELALVDCGPIGPDHLPAHAHGDVLSFEWSVGGRRVVVDTGVLEYAVGPDRARSRSTAAHNTVTLDGGDQAEFWSAFRVARRPRVTVGLYERRALGFVLEGSHDGYAELAGGPRHVRRFDVRSHVIAVEDRVAGGAGQAAVARLLLAPGLDLARAGGDHLIVGDGVRVRLRTAAAVTVVDAPYWPDFGVEQRARQIVLDYGAAPCSGGFVLEAE